MIKELWHYFKLSPITTLGMLIFAGCFFAYLVKGWNLSMVLLIATIFTFGNITWMGEYVDRIRDLEQENKDLRAMHLKDTF
jgi:hypothetical protein